MIYLQTATANQVIITVQQACENQYNPFFAWKLINTQSKEEVVFCADDNSPAPWYYNSFTISTTGIGLTNGIINSPAGNYSYMVYETNARFSLDTSGKLLDTGILIISSTESNDTTPSWSNEDTIPYYKNLD